MTLNRFVYLLVSALPALAAIFQVQKVPSHLHDSSTLYDNIKVLRIPTGHDISKLESLISKYQLNTWTEHPLPNSHIDVEVPAEVYWNFTTTVNGILEEDGITAPMITMHEDLGESIRKESEGIVPASELKAQAGSLASLAWFKSYHPYADHLAFLDDLVAQYPQNSKIVSSGKSFEGRDIKGINIFGSSGSGNKPAIIWHSTVHAREWIATMVNEFLAYSLLTQYGNSPQVGGLVNKFDFYIFPIVNPDGFVYSQTSNRLWRKNRQSPPPGSSCWGIDINRNWNVEWSTPGGASTDPCSDTYKGQAPEDAPETKALAKFIDARAISPAGAKLFIDWHSYSQLLLFPYGYNCFKVAADDHELRMLASNFTSVVKKVYGTPFISGPACSTLYAVTGGSIDYTYDVSKIKYSFVAELRDTGTHGFILPRKQILPSSEEIWAGVKYLLENLN